jgi:molecular chaperone DnaK (HSP70)
VEPVKKSNKLLNTLNKNAVTVVADYLRFVWNYTMEDIQRRQGADFMSIYALRVIITVPAMWTPAAKEKTLLAAKTAGFSDNITLVTEPEAAALATLKDKWETEDIKV